jgi:hypothetical protein
MREFKEHKAALTAAIAAFARDPGDAVRTNALPHLMVYAVENDFPADMNLDQVAVSTMHKLQANRRREKVQDAVFLTLWYGGFLMLPMTLLAVWLLDPVRTWGLHPLLMMVPALCGVASFFGAGMIARGIFPDDDLLHLNAEERAVGGFFGDEWEPSLA